MKKTISRHCRRGFETTGLSCFRASLELAADGLACSNDRCNAKFAAVDGIPILINQQRSLFDAATFVRKAPTFFKPVGRLRRWVSNSIPTLSANVTARANFRQFRDQLRRRAGRPRVLVIGGSIVGDGVESLVSDPTIELLETDVALGPRTQLICDAHDIPFRDETFDGVILQAVLEHVVDPRCMEEVYRVLRPGGLVYADTPFMQQVHGREFDFTRFTRLGTAGCSADSASLPAGSPVVRRGAGLVGAILPAELLQRIVVAGRGQRVLPPGLLLAQVFRLLPGLQAGGAGCGFGLLLLGREEPAGVFRSRVDSILPRRVLLIRREPAGGQGEVSDRPPPQRN